MSPRGTALLLWGLAMALGIAVLAHTHFRNDLSAFLPRAPSGMQRLLLEQLQNGPATHMVLVGIQGGSSPQRSQTVRAMADTLVTQPGIDSVEDGAEAALERDRAFVFEHRYLLSPGISAGAFDTAALHSALEASLEWLASPAGALLGKSLLASDPTGETLRIADTFDTGAERLRLEGAWASRDGRRALMLVRLRSSGADLDGQAQALARIRQAFARAAPPGGALQLLLSGPAVFAVQARESIEYEVRRVSILGGALILGLLLLAYRSFVRVLLGMLPVLGGALYGIASVSLASGVVHGITLGFGTTLIGESVDYSIYLFVQNRPESTSRLWPTLGLGMLTSICGFMALVLSSFPGLEQLGIYSIAGLLAAAAVTRWILPPLLAADGSRMAHLETLGRRAMALRAAVPGTGILVATLALAAAGWLYHQRQALWNADLAALSPVAAGAQALDAELRSQIGAPDVSNLVVIEGADEQSALQRAESAGRILDGLIDQGIIAGYESPARYLPSARTQQERRESLPAPEVLRARLQAAGRDLPIRTGALEPFVSAIAATRASPGIDRASLDGTSLAAGVDALLWQGDGGWHALLPLRSGSHDAARDIGRIDASLAQVGGARAINLKRETDALYGGYLAEAIRLSTWGLAAIVLLLALALRSPWRVLRVMLPLLASVLVVSAVLAASGTKLTLLHLIGLLLVVAVGSNYALFFDRRPAEDAGLSPLTVASLLIANATAVIGFGVLASANVPVLNALGSTVAPGALLALCFSAALTPRSAFAPRVRP